MDTQDPPQVFNGYAVTECEIQTIVINTNYTYISFNKCIIGKLNICRKDIIKREKIELSLESIENIGKKDFIKF